MTFVDKNIVESYLEGLSSDDKLELIERLAKSLKAGKKKREKKKNPFEGFIPEKSAEEIITDLRSARKFRKREIEF